MLVKVSGRLKLEVDRWSTSYGSELVDEAEFVGFEMVKIRWRRRRFYHLI